MCVDVGSRCGLRKSGHVGLVEGYYVFVHGGIFLCSLTLLCRGRVAADSHIVEHLLQNTPSWSSVVVVQVKELAVETEGASRLPWCARGEALEVAHLDTSFNALALLANGAGICELQLLNSFFCPIDGLVRVLMADAVGNASYKSACVGGRLALLCNTLGQVLSSQG